MGAADILKMIETVSPDDTAKLDEIDARVWCWLKGYELTDLREKGFDYCEILRDGDRLHGFQSLKSSLRSVPAFSRSRDALKAIRPEGYTFNITDASVVGQPEWHCTCQQKSNPWVIGNIEWFETEELAELHAIIQAIEYERTK